MKISIEIDCTPAEARAFFGLPDVEPAQRAILAALQERMAETIKTMGPETLFKTWFPAGFQGLEAWQKSFWSHLAEAAKEKGGKR